MSQVAWPDGWSFVHLTPVTVAGGQAYVGRTVSVARGAERMRAARVVERCDEQIVTMAWPDADEVWVYLGDKGTPFDGADDSDAARMPWCRVTRAQYRRDGGVHLPQPLPARGCVVHLVPVTFSEGHTIEGEVTSVDYPGLARVRYQLEPVQVAKRAWLQLTLLPELDFAGSPPFVLVHNPDRLPLRLDDGQPIDGYHRRDPGSATAKTIQPAKLHRGGTDLVWRIAPGGLRGYVRLFAALRPEHQSTFAIIDPPLPQLWLGSADGRS